MALYQGCGIAIVLFLAAVLPPFPLHSARLFIALMSGTTAVLCAWIHLDVGQRVRIDKKRYIFLLCVPTACGMCWLQLSIATYLMLFGAPAGVYVYVHFMTIFACCAVLWILIDTAYTVARDELPDELKPFWR